MAPWEFLEHTADVGLSASGDSLETAFADAGLGLFDLITGGAGIRRETECRFAVESIDRPGLLVAFLTHLLYLFETEKLVFGSMSVYFTGEASAEVTAHGEAFNEARHSGGIAVKAVSYHKMQIIEPVGGAPAEVRVLLDV